MSAVRCVLLGLVTLLALVARAEAQDDGMQIRLRLLYQIPELDTDIRVDATRFVSGSSFTADGTLDADAELFVPQFEVELQTNGFGRYSLEYFEFRLRGATFLNEPIFFDGLNFSRGAGVRSKYEFRTINFTAGASLPIQDWIDIQFLGSARYVRWFTSITSPSDLAAADDTTETIIPTIGLGADLFIFEPVYIFGSYQALGYSVDGRKTSRFLFLEQDSRVFLRDWRAGLRVELFPWFSLRGEYRSLTLRVKKGKARYRQDRDAVLIGVEISFL